MEKKKETNWILDKKKTIKKKSIQDFKTDLIKLAETKTASVTPPLFLVSVSVCQNMKLSIKIKWDAKLLL